MTTDTNSRQDGGSVLDFANESRELQDLGAKIAAKLKKRQEAQAKSEAKVEAKAEAKTMDSGKNIKSKYQNMSAEIAHEMTELASLRRTIEDKLDRSDAKLLNTNITSLFGVAKKPQTKEEYLVAFKRGFLKLYDTRLTKEQVEKLDEFIAEHIAKEDNTYFPGGKFDKYAAKFDCEALFEIRGTIGGRLELYLETPVIPPEFQGINTIGDLIKKYSAEVAAKAQADKENAAAKAEQEKKAKDLEAKVDETNKAKEKAAKESAEKEKKYNSQLEEADKKFKEQQKQFAAAKEEIDKNCGRIAELSDKVNSFEENMYNLVYSFGRSGAADDVKEDVYRRYLGIDPKDEKTKAAVLNSLAAVVSKRDRAEAIKILTSAIDLQKKVYASTKLKDDELRLKMYENNLTGLQ